MGPVLVLGVATLLFVGLSLCRANWFRLADAMYRLGPDTQTALGWPTAHPFSHIDPNADGQGGALGLFPLRQTRARVMLHGLPPNGCPPEAQAHAHRFRLWGWGVAVVVLISAMVIHPGAVLLGVALVALGWATVRRWPKAEDLSQ